MYLHNEFINVLKSHYRSAHPGNICQLLEALNKLAKLGRVFIEPSFHNNALYCSFKLNDTSYQALMYKRGDAGCMELCEWAGSILQALRAKGVQC